MNTMHKSIHGVIVTPLTKIPDHRGSVYHMLRADDPVFTKFGEIYFSTVYPGVIKGWHLHEKMTLRYAVVSGMIKLVLYDNRKSSPTKNAFMELFIGDENYLLVVIPPGIWNGFQGIGTKTAIVANLADIPHDPKEIQRIDPIRNKIIPYRW